VTVALRNSHRRRHDASRQMRVLMPGVTEREIGLHLFPKCFWWLNCSTKIIGLTSLL
jgi:hypothetical protein